MVVLRKGKGKIDPLLDMVEICQSMHWDYNTFLNQPTWFIDLIRAKKNTEAQFNEWRAKKL